jgi:type I restriction enzyme S subunit
MCASIKPEKNWEPYPAYRPSGIEWPGEIPEGWEARRVKTVVSFEYGDSLPSDSRESGEVPVLGSNGIVGEHNIANTLAPSIIVGRKGSYGKITYSENPCFAIDTTYFIDRTTTSQDIRWLYYTLIILKLDKFSEDSAVPGLSREYAYSRRIPVPDIQIQTAIASFLDRETAKIDELIARKERLIELLEEKRTAIISLAVTKGLDADAAMKNSRVEWLGDIPETWEFWRLKYVTKLLTEKTKQRGFTVALENIESGKGSLIETESEYEGDGIAFIEGDI